MESWSRCSSPLRSPRRTCGARSKRRDQSSTPTRTDAGETIFGVALNAGVILAAQRHTALEIGAGYSQVNSHGGTPSARTNVQENSIELSTLALRNVQRVRRERYHATRRAGADTQRVARGETDF